MCHRGGAWSWLASFAKWGSTNLPTLSREMLLVAMVTVYWQALPPRRSAKCSHVFFPWVLTPRSVMEAESVAQGVKELAQPHVDRNRCRRHAAPGSGSGAQAPPPFPTDCADSPWGRWVLAPGAAQGERRCTGTLGHCMSVPAMATVGRQPTWKGRRRAKSHAVEHTVSRRNAWTHRLWRWTLGTI